MRLLVVEDEHSLREDIARKLRLSGYEVDACADGEAALEALAAERYDLVLLDLNLPKVDGMQVLRTLPAGTFETCVLGSYQHAVKLQIKWRAGCRGERLPFQALSPCRAGSLGTQTDLAQIYPAGCLPVLRTAQLASTPAAALLLWTVRPLP